MNNASDIGSILIALGRAIKMFWWFIFPITFYYIFKILWIDFSGWYSANSWFQSHKYTLLEIIPPREIEKGPKMMENIFLGMSGVLTSYNTFDLYISGKWFHERFGLELVGAEGKAHFYIRTQKKYKNLIEAQVYAQYPDAEILEVPDYTENFPKIIPNKDWNLWGTDFEFTTKDPIPIKTYDKFEESVTGEMNDPMSALLEVIGTLGPGQHIWLQYILQPLPEPDNKKYVTVIKELKGEKVEAPKGLLEHLTDVLVSVPKGIFSLVTFGAADKKDLQPLEFRLSPGEKELLKATEENVGKNMFLTKMRLINLARREVYDQTFVSAFIGAIKQFNDINYNQVKPEDISKTYGKIFFTKSRADFRRRKIYGRYKRRNVDDAKIVLSTKELATLFHFPDMSVKSPSIKQVESKLGSAPANLPVK